MISPDVLVTWPRSCDYPLWRQMIRDSREKFSRIIVVFMETNTGNNYREFIRESMASDNIDFLESPIVAAGQDWRDIAVNFGLSFARSYSDREWLWFTEQDFFPKENFWEEVNNLVDDLHADYIGIKDGERLHPACLFIKKIIIDRTSRNFGIIPNVSDHFSIIQKDLENMNLIRALLSPDSYTHMAGLSSNMSLLERGEAPNHDVENFMKYMKACMEVKVPVHEDFKNLYYTYINL